MKFAAVILSLLLVLPTAAQRLSIREENDVWTGSDSSYTQGAEIEYLFPITIKSDHLTRYGISLRNLIYTPENITIAEPQPDDRPWCGLSAITLKQQQQRGTELLEQQLLIGVVGPWSYSEQIQTEFHRYIGVDLPEGWDNQMDNEVVVNYAINGIHPFVTLGRPDGWAADIAGTYGAALGTAFIYADGGALVRAGYNLPSHRLNIITPTALNWSPIFYVFGRASERVVAHNISINGSYFQDGPNQNLEPLVADLQVGISAGLEHFEYQGQRYNILLSYAATRRTREFKGQNDDTDFGTISLTAGYDF